MEYVITPQAITVYVRGTGYQVTQSHMNYSQIRQGLKEGSLTEDELLELLDVGRFVYNLSLGQLQLEDGVIYYNGMELNNALSHRMFEIAKQNGDLNPFILFLENLVENPSGTAINELYTFLGKNDLPITNDGQFLAYKAVNQDYTDMYSGTFSNRPGALLEMAREDVDPDRNNTCSRGFHVASQGYMEMMYGTNPIMVVEVNPRDVVTVPADHNDQKMRVCQYTVVRELVQNERIRPYYADNDDVSVPGWASEEDEDEFYDEPEDDDYLSPDDIYDDLYGEFERVEWTSQANGFSTVKVGFYVDTLYAHQSLRETWSSLNRVYPILMDLDVSVPSKIKDTSNKRRAIVLVDTILSISGEVLKEFEMPQLYCPLESKIATVEE